MTARVRPYGSVSPWRTGSGPVACLGGTLCFAAAFVLYRFPPALYHIYPVCPIHEYLHLECPGCGATRAIAALLHGQFGTAIHLNALAVVLGFPLALGYAAVCFYRLGKDDEFRWPAVPRGAIVALATVSAAFTVIRNL